MCHLLLFRLFLGCVFYVSTFDISTFRVLLYFSTFRGFSLFSVVFDFSLQWLTCTFQDFLTLRLFGFSGVLHKFSRFLQLFDFRFSDFGVQFGIVHLSAPQPLANTASIGNR